jgi:hypothetical protein
VRRPPIPIRVRKGRDGILGIVLWSRRGLPGFIEHQFDFGEREARDLQVEFEVDQGLQFNGEKLTVPAGVEGELVVRQDICPALSRIEMRQAKRGDAFHAEELGGFDPPMSGNNLVVVADEDRIGEPELADAVGDLSDLTPGMCSGVTRVRPQACDRDRFNALAGQVHNGRDLGHFRGLQLVAPRQIT